MRSLLTGLLMIVTGAFTWAQANGWAHGSIPFEALIAGLEAGDVATQSRSAQYLGRRGRPEAVDPLIAVLERDEVDPGVRAAVYGALGELGDARGLPVLRECMTGEARQELRMACVTALGAMREFGTLEDVLAALDEDESIVVRARAIDTLGLFDQAESINVLSGFTGPDANPSLRRRAIIALGRTGSLSAAGPLLQILAMPADDAERLLAVEALAGIGAPGAVRPLQDLLAESEDPSLRIAATVALGATADGNVTETLVALLNDDQPVVRHYAMLGLHETGDAAHAEAILGAVETILPWLQESLPKAAEDPDPAARMMLELRVLSTALRALIDLDAPVAQETFAKLAALQAYRPSGTIALKILGPLIDVQRLSILGLGYAGDAAAMPLLIDERGLLHGNPAMRGAAVRAIAMLDAPGAADLLVPMLGDPVVDVRTAAALALGRLGGGGDVAVAALIDALDDPHSLVRREASLSLGYLANPAAGPALTAVADEDSDASVRAAAGYALSLLPAK